MRIFSQLQSLQLAMLDGSSSILTFVPSQASGTHTQGSRDNRKHHFPLTTGMDVHCSVDVLNLWHSHSVDDIRLRLVNLSRASSQLITREEKALMSSSSQEPSATVFDRK